MELTRRVHCSPVLHTDMLNFIRFKCASRHKPIPQRTVLLTTLTYLLRSSIRLKSHPSSRLDRCLKPNFQQPVTQRNATQRKLNFEKYATQRNATCRNVPFRTVRNARMNGKKYATLRLSCENVRGGGGFLLFFYFMSDIACIINIIPQLIKICHA